MCLFTAVSWFGSIALAGTLDARNDPRGSDRSPAEVKAALVYKFLRFVEWKDDRFPKSSSPLSVATVGSGDVVKELKRALKGKRFGKRKIEFRQFKTPEDVKDVHLLFVTDAVGKGEDLQAALKRLPKRGVFVVGESALLTIKGGVLNFYVEGSGKSGNVRFEINPDEAKRRQIKISADLLKLAKIVRDPEDDERAEAGEEDR